MNISYSIQVVQEYERAVIFRLGRLLAGGSRGPGKLDQHNLLIISGHNYLDTKCSSDPSQTISLMN